jgi:hypothetical protein
MTSPATYSNSQLQSYKNCPLQWRLYWDLGLRRLDDDASDHHLRYGHAVHAGLETIYRGGSLREAQDRFLENYPTQLDVNDKAKTRQNGITALREYVKRWGAGDRKWRVVEIETRSDDPWSVKPDLVVEHVDHGGLYLVDHKTTGQYLNYKYWERFQPNSQITHYLDYGIAKYGPIEGFIINAISFRYNERASKNAPQAGFWCNFERQTFNRRSEQLDYERASRAEWIADIERSRSLGFWRTNTDACWRCQYKSICAPGWTWEEDRELIEIQYYQACDALLADDQHCVLVREHEGECSAAAAQSKRAMEFEIEV